MPQQQTFMGALAKRIARDARERQSAKPEGYWKKHPTLKSARAALVVNDPPPMRDPQGVLGHAARPRKPRRR